MEKCLVCNKEFKKVVPAHVMLHGLKWKEYGLLKKSREIHTKDEDTFDDENVEDASDDENVEDTSDGLEEIEYRHEDVKISHDEMQDAIFKDSTTERNPARPIGEFLAEFKITEKELRQVVKQYKGGEAISVSQGIENKIERGKNIAESLKDREVVETQDVYTAETLTREYGFICKEVRSGPPKMWILYKQ